MQAVFLNMQGQLVRPGKSSLHRRGNVLAKLEVRSVLWLPPLNSTACSPHSLKTFARSLGYAPRPRNHSNVVYLWPKTSTSGKCLCAAAAGACVEAASALAAGSARRGAFGWGAASASALRGRFPSAAGSDAIVLIAPRAVTRSVAWHRPQVMGTESGESAFGHFFLSLIKWSLAPQAMHLLLTMRLASSNMSLLSWLGRGRVCVQPPRRPSVTAAIGNFSTIA